MPRLKGPKAKRTPIEWPAELQALPTATRHTLQLSIDQLTFRWKPMTSDPDGLTRDLLALVAWILEGMPDRVPQGRHILDIYDDTATVSVVPVAGRTLHLVVAGVDLRSPGPAAATPAADSPPGPGG